MDFNSMEDERKAGREIIEALEAIDHWDAIIRLDKLARESHHRHEGMKAAFEVALQQYSDLSEKMERYADRMLDIVGDLARCGSYDDKGKNEVILGVIHLLMTWQTGMRKRREIPDMEDVPF